MNTRYTFLLSILLLAVLIACESSMDKSADVGPGGQAGVGGSMARFAIAGDRLYAVTPASLKVYDVTSPGNPKPGMTLPMSFGVETVFPYKNNLFIGAQDGMYIFDNSNPDQPRQLSKYEHVMSCDPVVVQGNYAYVTLRGGVACRRWNPGVSSLDVIDISNLSQPRMILSMPMTSPYGLGIDGSQLFVCEGDAGLKTFDVTNPAQPKLKQHLRDVQSYDVIPLRNILLVTGQGGLRQYDYSNPEQMTLLSLIPVEP